MYLKSSISKTQFVKSAPDLIISKIKRQGNKYKVTIKNQGTIASKKTKLKVSFKDGKKVKQKVVDVKAIKAAKSTTATIKFFKYSIHKKYTKTATVNYNRSVKEFSYKNNIKKFRA
jgi:hypothetical protein